MADRVPAWLLLALLLLPGALPVVLAPTLAHEGTHRPAEADGRADAPEVVGEAARDPEAVAAALAAAREADLFGAFAPDGDGTFQGHFVGLALPGGTEADAPRLQDLRFRGAPLLDAVDAAALGTAAMHMDGPAWFLQGEGGAVTVHDNRHAWMSVRVDGGPVELRLPEGATATPAPDRPDHVRLATPAGPYHLFLEEPGRFELVEGAVRVHGAEDGGVALTGSAEPGVFGTSHRAGAWVLAAHADGATLADVLRVLAPGSWLEDAGGERLVLDVVGTLGGGARPVLVRAETTGLFAAPQVDRFTARLAGAFLPRAAEDGLMAPGAEQGHSVAVEAAGDDLGGGGGGGDGGGDGVVTRHHVLAPTGRAGLLHIVQDLAAPRVWAVQMEDAGPPCCNATARIAVVADEPATGPLRLLDAQGQEVAASLGDAAVEVHRLAMEAPLRPDADYRVVGTLRDAVGHATQVDVAVRTPPAEAPPALRTDLHLTLAPDQPLHIAGSAAGAARPLLVEPGEAVALRLDLALPSTVVEARLLPGAVDVARARQVVPLLDGANFAEAVTFDPSELDDPSARVAHLTTAEDGTLVVRLAVPGPGAATLRLARDVTPPRFTLGPVEALDHRSFLLSTTTDEPAVATLVRTPATGGPEVRLPTPNPAMRQTFPVQGLDPATTYQVRVRFADWSGNEAWSEAFTVTTPPRPMVAVPSVEALAPAPGSTVRGEQVAVRARITSAGSPVFAEDVRVFFDKREVHHAVRLEDGLLALDVGGLAPGLHTVLVEATNGLGGTGKAQWEFTLEERASPAPGAVGLLLLVAGAAWAAGATGLKPRLGGRAGTGQVWDAQRRRARPHPRGDRKPRGRTPIRCR